MDNLLSRMLRFISSGMNHQQDTSPQENPKFDLELQSEDRKIFEVFCQFIWFQGDPLPLILDIHDKIYTEQGITQESLQKLEAIGLIQLNRSGFIKRGLGKHTRLFYCGKPTKIGFLHDADNSLDLGHALLTNQGKELALTIHAARNQRFYEYVIKRWFQEGLLLSSIQINKNWKTTPSHSACFLTEQE